MNFKTCELKKIKIVIIMNRIKKPVVSDRASPTFIELTYINIYFTFIYVGKFVKLNPTRGDASVGGVGVCH